MKSAELGERAGDQAAAEHAYAHRRATEHARAPAEHARVPPSHCPDGRALICRLEDHDVLIQRGAAEHVHGQTPEDVRAL